MIDKALKTVEKYNMLSCGDSVVAAVSGGADSMAMLYFLLCIREKYDLKITVAHMEHGIRGEESLGDARLVKSYCREHNVDFLIKHIDAVGEARIAGLGVEEYSRIKRYEFFNSIPCDKICTAHSLSDNAETVLFRLVRGTGLKGVCGIPPVRDRIIRPFIELTSREIRDFCAWQGIPYRIDSTNDLCDCSRNIIRNEVMPLLEKVNNGAQEAVAAFASDAVDDYGFIEHAAELAYDDCRDGDKLIIQKLSAYDSAVRKRIILKYFSDFGVSLDRQHLMSVLCILGKPSRVQIKGSLFAVSDKKYLRLADFAESGSDFNNVKFIKEILNINEFQPEDIDFYCDCDKIVGDITVRKRMPGDSIRPAGRGCTKSLKKLFNECSYPVEKRDATIVICDASGVIGVAGICADERVRADNNTKNILSIKLPAED